MHVIFVFVDIYHTVIEKKSKLKFKIDFEKIGNDINSFYLIYIPPLMHCMVRQLMVQLGYESLFDVAFAFRPFFSVQFSFSAFFVFILFKKFTKFSKRIQMNMFKRSL